MFWIAPCEKTIFWKKCSYEVLSTSQRYIRQTHRYLLHNVAYWFHASWLLCVALVASGTPLQQYCQLFTIQYWGMSLSGYKVSRIMRNPDFCLCQNKSTDQLRSKCTADQRICFRYKDSAIPLLLIFQDFSFLLWVYLGRFVSDLVGDPENRFSHDGRLELSLVFFPAYFPCFWEWWSYMCLSSSCLHTNTGTCEWCRIYPLTVPRIVRLMAPKPRLPQTIKSALSLSAALTITSPALPSRRSNLCLT